MPRSIVNLSRLVHQLKINLRLFCIFRAINREKMKTLLSLAAILIATTATAQNVSYDLQNRTATKVGTVNLSEKQDQTDWNTRVINLEMPAPGGESYRSFLREQKAIQREKYPLRNDRISDHVNRNAATAPDIGQSFEGNEAGNSVPMDNSMAISNDGILISTINSNIWMYDVNNNNELLYSASFNSFVNFSLGFPSKYDPKIIYDPIEDRFIFVFLYGNTPAVSKIIVSFSESGNPLGDWSIYELPGNPFDNNRWTDYPAISQNAEDFFITANLIIPGEPWQTGFDGTIVWQIPKSSGYNGDEELETSLWSAITYDDQLVRNVNPVDGEMTFDDNNMFFLSNRNFALANDTIFLIEVTNTVTSGEAELTLQALVSSDEYFLAPEARQPNDHTFDTNDSRVLGAVLFDNSIQFVQNCLDSLTGVTGVYHGIIEDVYGTPQVSGNIISFPVEDIDLGYPNISHIGESGGDENTLISFVHSGPNDFAGTSCVLYDEFTDEYSERVVLKEGDDYVDVLFGVYERWGDYSGSQPMYNAPGTVWIAGSFGTEQQRNGTWIAELGVSGQFVGLEDGDNNTGITATPFPNPASNMVSVNLELPKTTLANIYLYNSSGQMVTQLFGDRIKSGRNLLSFDVSSLSPGQYFVNVTTEDGSQLTEKLIVE